MSARICPECRGWMNEEVHNGITLDKCSQCNGIYLDFWELKDLIENIHRVATFKTVQKWDFSRDNSHTNIICAGCNNIMDEREYIYWSGNHINFCANCGWVYLDAWEIKQLEDFEISRTESNEWKNLLKNLELKGIEISENQKEILDEIWKEDMWVLWKIFWVLLSNIKK